MGEGVAVLGHQGAQQGLTAIGKRAVTAFADGTQNIAVVGVAVVAKVHILVKVVNPWRGLEIVKIYVGEGGEPFDHMPLKRQVGIKVAVFIVYYEFGD